MKIVMLESIGISKSKVKEYASKLENEGHEFIYYEDRVENENKIIKRCKDADIIIISNLPLTDKVIKKCSKLKMISVAFTGIDHIDIESCKKENIMVCNSSGYADEGVAELTFGLIISVMRNIISCDKATRNGETREALIGNEICGKKLGIVGTGNIGKRVAEIGKAFNCQLLGYDKVEKDELKNIGLKYVELDKLMQESEIVTLHVPLKEDTESLINEKRISQMRSDSILINTSRGPVVESKPLAKALKNGDIEGAGIDVFEKEAPISGDHP